MGSGRADRSITIPQVDLDHKVPSIQLQPSAAKNRNGATLPLPIDLATAIKNWIAERRAGASSSGAVPIRDLAECPAELLFDVPTALVKILNRDLKAAGIPKHDERGRSIDVHAMRHTFGTMLAAAGVVPRVAQESMRHSSIDLTMNVYTDPRLLDVAGAIESLPTFSSSQVATYQATGTDDQPMQQGTLAPTLVPTPENSCARVTISDNVGDLGSLTVDAAEMKKPLANKGFDGVSASGPEEDRTPDLCIAPAEVGASAAPVPAPAHTGQPGSPGRPAAPVRLGRVSGSS